ncbi:MAG: hypothetical protein ACR2MT_15150, partial [Aurantibacter sp.]
MDKTYKIKNRPPVGGRFFMSDIFKVLRYLYHVGQHTNFLAVDFYIQLTQNLAQITFFLVICHFYAISCTKKHR